MTNSTSKKFELYRAAQQHGREVSFIANVIFCHHSRPTKKLAGLVALLNAGHSVSLASFSMDVLQIDGGGKFSFSDLERGVAILEPRSRNFTQETLELMHEGENSL